MHCLDGRNIFKPTVYVVRLRFYVPALGATYDYYLQNRVKAEESKSVKNNM